jgi:hypothetical protein
VARLEGREEGREEGRREGRQQGRQEGEKIGMIHFLERLLNRPQTPTEHPDKFACIGGFSSALFGKANVPSDADANKIRFLWVSCGDKDTLLKGNQAFHESLTQQTIPHTRHLESGGHSFPVWRNDLYLFAQRLFRDK